MAVLEANRRSGWKVRNTAEVSLLLLSRANGFPTKTSCNGIGEEMEEEPQCTLRSVLHTAVSCGVLI